MKTAKMGAKMIKYILLIAVFLFETATSGSHPGIENDQDRPFKETVKNTTIKVVYDNNPYNDELRTAWGFSCVIRFHGKRILFDTGGDSQTLLFNMEQLGIDPKEIDVVILSHIHGDHVGGLFGFLKQNSNVVVYLPKSFPLSFKNKIISYGARFEEIDEGRNLFNKIYTTGELGTWIKEQSLILNTTKGLVIITGCAHPGVVHIIERSKKLIGVDPLLVTGGFHLGGTSEGELKQIIDDFIRLNVQKVGPCHCSGDRARRLFQEAYGKHFMEVGVGRVIIIDK
jgi:7,8-dihydropterin-6-yl-methyl-4-(beta-D-ribofuranosyl)aminobenzene 5'-phosphate synthase